MYCMSHLSIQSWQSHFYLLWQCCDLFFCCPDLQVMEDRWRGETILQSTFSSKMLSLGHVAASTQPTGTRGQQVQLSSCLYVSVHLCPASCLNLYLCSSSACWCSVGQCIVCVSTWTPPSAGISASSCPPGPETSPLHLLEFPESQHACEHSAASQACTHEFRLEGWAELQHLCCSVWHFYCTTCFHLSVRVARGGWVSLQICPSFQSGPNCWAGRWTAGGAAVVGGF